MAPFSGDETAPFFGFLGAAAALVFSCNSFPLFSIRSIFTFSRSFWFLFNFIF
ncbi:hypothetical protein Lalb_Chr03g0025311 [Lupinus albus]|uniref:Uncharacterized protein n=1 Tax=Lupinus albus TaxID=3870 RepID=A0A6A4QS38_LUPAL|nr:hypothetical protein Lalb_Chr03g0025311 [Lupinus albus]